MAPEDKSGFVLLFQSNHDSITERIGAGEEAGSGAGPKS
jgi:hypothetical protein